MIREEDMNNLSAPTPLEVRKYRVGNTFDWDNKKIANMLCYVDARYVMDRLDAVVGGANWDSEFLEIKGRLYCKIPIRYVREDGSIGSAFKMDCGTEGNIEKEKAEASDALKRTAVQFGIGRELYSSKNYRVEMQQSKNGKWYTPKDWKPEGDK